MNQAIKTLSPFALGLALCAYQALQLPVAQAASLALGSTNTPETVDPPVSPTAAVDCLPGALPATEGLPGEVTPSGDRPFSGLNYQSNLDLPADPTPTSKDSTSTLIAQLSPDDCCEVGGTATCEVAGLPPQGGGLLASPLWALAALPLAGIPFIGGSDPNRPRPPVPLSESSTAGLVAGFGLMGLWYSRRYRQDDAE